MQRRFKTFFAKWGGLVLAVVLVIPAAYFGGTYLYASSRVEATLAWVTQDVNLDDSFLTLVSKQNEPPQSTYRLVLVVNDRMADVAELEVSDITVKLNEFTLPVTEIGSWQKGIVPGGSASFEGDITLSSETVQKLAAAGRVDYTISGTIKGTAHYSWVKKTRTEPISLSSHGSFLPPTSTATTTTTPPPTPGV